MKRILTITLIVGALLSSSGLCAQPGLCSAVATRSPQKGEGEIDTTYSATTILDIEVLALFSNAQAKQMSGDHVVEFRINTPNGHLYQSISVPFSADEKLRGTKRKVKRYPREMATLVLEPVQYENRPHWAVSARLPVAGTSIIGSSLYGTWTAEALIDGAPLRCSDRVNFEITQ